jgi:HK97 gp10 family phage protein
VPKNVLVQIEGLPRATKRIQGLERAVRNQVVKASLTAAVLPILDAMITGCPVDTGNLRDSLGMRYKQYKSGKVHVVVIGPRRGEKWTNEKSKMRASRYAHLLEFGTSKMPAQPFIRPAWDANKGAFPAKMHAALISALKAAGAI